jgi:hypothetical protein
MVDSLFPRPKSIKTLRKYYRERDIAEDPESYRDNFRKETDRAIIMLTSTILEDVLAYRLSQAFCHDVRDEDIDFVFRFEGPLGTFSARIEIGYLFGLIEKPIAEQLDLIREIRNACAHSKFTLSFKEGVLVNVIKKIFRPRGVVALTTESPEELKEAFLLEWSIIYRSLLRGSRAAAIDALQLHLGAHAAAFPSRDKWLPQ